MTGNEPFLYDDKGHFLLEARLPDYFSWGKDDTWLDLYHPKGAYHIIHKRTFQHFCSAQPNANPVLVNSNFIFKLESSFNSLVETEYILRSDFILRSLYIFQNLILFKNGKSLTTSWMLNGETLERVNKFSTSMQLSPAIVERALSIVRSV